MAKGGVKSTFHYVPLHSAPYGRAVAGDVTLPVTDFVAAGLARLPIYPELTTASVDRVIEQTLAFAG